MTGHPTGSQHGGELLPIIDEHYCATVIESCDSEQQPITTIRVEAIVNLCGHCPFEHRTYLRDAEDRFGYLGQALADRVNDEARTDPYYLMRANGRITPDQYARLHELLPLSRATDFGASELLPIMDEQYSATVTGSSDPGQAPFTTIRLGLIVNLRGPCPIADRPYLSDGGTAYRRLAHAIVDSINEEARNDSYYRMLVNHAITFTTYERLKGYRIGPSPDEAELQLPDKTQRSEADRKRTTKNVKKAHSKDDWPAWTHLRDDLPWWAIVRAPERKPRTRKRFDKTTPFRPIDRYK